MMSYLDLRAEVADITSRTGAETRFAYWAFGLSLNKFRERFGDAAALTYRAKDGLRTTPIDEKTNIDCDTGLVTVRDPSQSGGYRQIFLADIQAVSIPEARQMVIK
jgi:hypothetical protein